MQAGSRIEARPLKSMASFRGEVEKGPEGNRPPWASILGNTVSTPTLIVTMETVATVSCGTCGHGIQLKVLSHGLPRVCAPCNVIFQILSASIQSTVFLRLNAALD